jgi:hypothetical protein
LLSINNISTKKTSKIKHSGMPLEIFKFAPPARRDPIAKRKDVALALAVAVAMAVRLSQKPASDAAAFGGLGPSAIHVLIG